MELRGKKIGFCFTGSFYTFKNTIDEIKKIIKRGGEVIPIMSYYAYSTDSRFGKSKDFISNVEKVTGKKIIHTMQEAEYISNYYELDIMIIAPCSGNTIAKIANSITDTPVLVAARTHLKDAKPLVLGFCCKDGLSTNAENIGKLLNRKDLYFVPFGQDNPITKPYSICFDYKYIIKSLESSLDKEQIQPLLN